MMIPKMNKIHVKSQVYWSDIGRYLCLINILGFKQRIFSCRNEIISIHLNNSKYQMSSNCYRSVILIYLFNLKKCEGQLCPFPWKLKKDSNEARKA